MSDFKVNSRRLKNNGDICKKLAIDLTRYSDTIYNIKNSLYIGVSTQMVQRQLNSLRFILRDDASTMNSLGTALEKIATKYDSTENSVLNQNTMSNNVLNYRGMGINELLGSKMTLLSPAVSVLVKLSRDINNASDNDDNRKIEIDNEKLKYKGDLIDIFKTDKEKNKNIFDKASKLKKYANKLADKAEEFNDKHKNEYDWIKGYYDKNNKYHDVRETIKPTEKEEQTYDSMELDKKATIWGKTFSESKSVRGNVKSGIALNGLATGELSYDILKSETSAAAYVALYSVDENGKKRFTPGIGAELGFAATAFTAGASGLIGNEYFDVHAKGDVTVGQVEVKGNANLGLFDKNGKINPQANVGLSGEAVVAKAEGSVGVKIAGTDVDLGGSVSVGVGAHANFGFKDGKLSIDVGASVGIGVSADLTIDFTDTIDVVQKQLGKAKDNVICIAKNVQSAWTGLKKLVSW